VDDVGGSEGGQTQSCPPFTRLWWAGGFKRGTYAPLRSVAQATGTSDPNYFVCDDHGSAHQIADLAGVWGVSRAKVNQVPKWSVRRRCEAAEAVRA